MARDTILKGRKTEIPYKNDVLLSSTPGYLESKDCEKRLCLKKGQEVKIQAIVFHVPLKHLKAISLNSSNGPPGT